jgi:hypothetical protein
MRKKMNLTGLLMLVFILLLISCAPTKFASVWKDDKYTGGALKSVFVVGVSDKIYNRKLFEDTFAERLKARGVKAAPSYPAILKFEDIEPDRVLSEADKLGMKAIIVTQLLGHEEEYINYEPLDYDPAKGNKGFGSRLPTSTEYVKSGGVYTKTKQVRLLTTVYDRKSEQLIWSAVTETFRPESVKETIDSLCDKVLGQLWRDDLIK